MADGSDDPSRERPPRLVTTSAARGAMALPIVTSVAVVLLLFVSTGPAMVGLVIALETGIWAVWWLRAGRFWHPIRELRWEMEEIHRGRHDWSEGYVSYRRAWEQAGGDPPPELHPPPSARRSRAGAGG